MVVDVVFEVGVGIIGNGIMVDVVVIWWDGCCIIRCCEGKVYIWFGGCIFGLIGFIYEFFKKIVCSILKVILF